MTVQQTVQLTENDRRLLVFSITKGGTAWNVSGLTITFTRILGTTATSIDTVSDAGQIDITDAAAGEVTVTPADNYWARGDYFTHMSVASGGKNYRFPDTEVIQFHVADDYLG